MIKSFSVTNDLNERMDLVLNDPWQSGIVIKSVDGLGPGKVTVHMKEVANGDGGFYSGSRMPIRNIVLNLAFVGSPTIEDSRLLTYRYFPVKKTVTLTVVTDNNEVSIDGYVESNEPDIFSNLEGCQISILCSNPYFYTERDQLTTSSGIFPMLEFPIDNELIEDPETDKRTPSDEPYIEYGEILVTKWSDNNIKYTPFNYRFFTGYVDGNTTRPTYQFLFNATTEDKTGKIPYEITGRYGGPEEDRPNRSMNSEYFWVRIPSYSSEFFKNGKKYTLSFVVDGDLSISPYGTLYQIVVLDIRVTVSGKTIYYSGYNHKYIDGYKTLPIASRERSDFKGENFFRNYYTTGMKVNVPLTNDILSDLDDENGFFRFEAVIGYMYSADDYPIVYPTAVTENYLITIRDIVINENNVEMRPGFAEEEDFIYKWNPYAIFLNYHIDFTSILSFNDVKTKMIWENSNDTWKPKSVGGNRIFVLQFDIDGQMVIKNNGHESKDYLSLEIRTNKIHEYIDICGIPVNNKLSNTIRNCKIGISEEAYYDLLYMMDGEYGGYITFTIFYNRYDSLKNDYKLENPGRHYTNGTPNMDNYAYLNNTAQVTNISFYEVLQPTTDQEILNRINYLIDDGMPDYAFTKDGKKYNMKASEGIIMGEIQKYGFEHLIRYDGSANIGFQITISFVHKLALFDESGLVGNPGFIVITSNFYPRKKMVVDLRKVWEIIQSAGENDGQVIPITEPGDQLFIDTRKNKKAIRYQKPYDYTYKNSKGETVVWDHAGYKINVLGASNRDIEWFELYQGDNILTIQHKSDPEMEREEDLDNDHSEYLEVEIRNRVYYEGV